MTADDILAGYVPEKDMARALKRSPRTLQRWRNQPDGLPYVELGGEILYNIDSFRKWLASRERQPNRRRGAS